MKKVSLLLFLAGSLTARAYDLNYDASSNIQHWDFTGSNGSIGTNVFNRNTHAIRYFIASDGYSATNTAAELNAIRASFGQWQSVPNTIIKFEDAGLHAPGYDVNAF